MDRPPQFRTLDEHGQPVSPRIESALISLVRRLQRDFPTFYDDGVLIETLEEAGRSIAQREAQVAFVTSAPCHLDAPSTMTLHVSTFGDVAGFAADDVALEEASARGAGRIVLVDTLELEWQRRRWRETGYPLAAADGTLVGLPMLQRWLWQRLKTRT